MERGRGWHTGNQVQRQKLTYAQMLTSIGTDLGGDGDLDWDATNEYLELENDAVTPMKMAHPTGADNVGKVMLIDTGGDPAWAFPFEFPTTVSGRGPVSRIVKYPAQYFNDQHNQFTNGSGYHYQVHRHAHERRRCGL